MDFISKVNSVYQKEIDKYKPAVDAIKTAAKGKDVVEKLPEKNRSEEGIER